MHEEHNWELASWRGNDSFAVSIWVCCCGATLRVVHDPSDLEILDPNNLQAEYIEREQGRVGVWTGE